MTAFIVIDGNSLAYAAQHARALTNADGEQTQCTFHTMSMLKNLMDRNQRYTRAIVLWDSRAQWRFDLYPEYKGKRSDDPQKVADKAQVKRQTPVIQELIRNLGIHQVIGNGFEADDYAGFFVRLLTSQGHRVLLGTGDEDWMQLVGTKVSWIDPRSGATKYVTGLNFTDFTGCRNASHFLQAKALEGDSSDCIQGVTGIGGKTAKLIMSEFDGVSGLKKAWENQNKTDFEKGELPKSLSRARVPINRFLNEEMGVFKRNLRLMNLMSPARDAEMKSVMRMTKGNYNLDRFMELAAEQGFMSIATKRSAWDKSFGAAH